MVLANQQTKEQVGSGRLGGKMRQMKNALDPPHKRIEGLLVAATGLEPVTQGL